MSRVLAVFLLFPFLLALPASAAEDAFGTGNGQDGDRTITGQVTLNAYASITAAVAAGATSVTLGSAAAFLPGDLVLLWQPVGMASVPVSGEQAPLDLTGHGAGRWELARVASIAGASLTLEGPTRHGYQAQHAQAVLVPEFENLTIDGGGEVGATGWAASRTGGIVAFLVRGVLRNDGLVLATSRGLRGGTRNAYESDYGCTALDGSQTDGFASKGEGLAPLYFGGGYGGYGNLSCGGGGGNCHNAGGGGGGHGGLGGRGGNTNDDNRPYGGLGGAPLQYSLLERMAPGGGGGAGQENNNSGTWGGAGGGVVFIRAGSLEGSGTIQANGRTTPDGSNDGIGGAGAGGAIVVRVVGSASCNYFRARGGNGGSADNGHGCGGGGGGGRILLQAASVACTLDCIGGSGGTNSDRSATAGGDGVVETPPTGGYCFLDSQCSGATPICGGDGACRACSPADCEALGQVCATSGPDAGACLECLGDGDCAQGERCDPATSACVECLESADCLLDPARTLCNPATLACVECLDAEACTDRNRPFCDVATFACRGCEAADCSGAEAICAATGPLSGRCVECEESLTCAAPLPLCDQAAGVCVECLTGADCSSATSPICDPAAKSCRACAGSEECGGLVCVLAALHPSAGACVQCLANADCAPGLICDVANTVCTGCSGDADCFNPLPICGVDERCRGCLERAECPLSSPVCAGDAPLAGWCVECSEADTEACPAAAPLCDPSNGLCVECLEHADCGDPAAPLCDDSTRLCAACAADFGTNEPLACRELALPACQVSGALAGQCTQCSATHDEACSGDAPVCHEASGSCGCASDADCGAEDSGRICDDALEPPTCEDGCRGLDGNGCPTGFECSSNDGEPGECVPVAADAGFPDAGGDAGPATPDAGLDGGAALPDGAVVVDGGGQPADGGSADGATGLPALGAYDLGGCGCSAGGGPAGLLGLLGLGFAVVRRRR